MQKWQGIPKLTEILHIFLSLHAMCILVKSVTNYAVYSDI